MPIIEEWINTVDQNLVKDISVLSLLLYNSYYRKRYTYEDYKFEYHQVDYHSAYSSVFKLDTKLELWIDCDTPNNISTHMLDKLDTYLTKIGKFLRETSIDESPQLFNALKGDMVYIYEKHNLLFIVE